MPEIIRVDVKVKNVVSNTSVNVIQITEDRLVNILTIHFMRLKKSREWLAALSFSVSLLIVLLTAEFKHTLGMSPDTWRAVFVILLCISFAYLVYTIRNCVIHKTSVIAIVEDIKKI